jgi:hypothetical protein
MKPSPTSFRVANYTIRAHIFSGAELPKFSMKSNKFFVHVSIGSFDMMTNCVNATKGMCSWNEDLETAHLELPTDVGQIPDVILRLYRLVGEHDPSIISKFRGFRFKRDCECCRAEVKHLKAVNQYVSSAFAPRIC